MDYLAKMMEMQDKLNGSMGLSANDINKLPEYEIRKWLTYYNSAQICESGEFWKEFGRWWREPKEGWRERALVEIIDEMHFLITKLLILGATSEEVFKVYSEKNKENLERPDHHHKKLDPVTLEHN